MTFCEEIVAFFKDGTMPLSWKKTVIVLIPKCNNPSKPKQFRPISLCNNLYKLVAMIIVKRLKLVLENLISEEQNALS